MARIKISDLPQDLQISKEEMKKVFGGLTTSIQTSVNLFGGVVVNTGSISGMTEDPEGPLANQGTLLLKV